MEITVTLLKDFTVPDIAGLVRKAEASIRVVALEKGSSMVDAKSILGVFSLGLKKGDSVTVLSDDEEVAKLVANELEAE